MIKGIFAKDRLLDIVKTFIVFENEKDSRNNVTKIIKKVAAYHQYFAVNKAVKQTVEAASPADKKAGVIWHTQGSGKSLTMVFFAGKVLQELDNPTLVLLTDRNDLDGQLFGTFSKCNELYSSDSQAGAGSDDLKKLLSVASGGVVFTTIQKVHAGGKGRQASASFRPQEHRRYR